MDTISARRVTVTLAINILVFFTIFQPFSWAAEPTIKVPSVSPNVVNVTSGGPEVALTLRGMGLDQITSCVVIRDRRLVSGVVATLEPSTASGRVVKLRAHANTIAGDAQLRLISGKTFVDVPLNVARISISSTQSSIMKISQVGSQQPTSSRSAIPVVTGKTTTVAQMGQSPKTISQVGSQKLSLQQRGLFTTTIDSSDFAALVSTVFSGAYMDVSLAPGGPIPASKISVHGTYNKNEWLPILNENLPDQVKRETTREAISYSSNPPMIRDGRIQATMERIKTLPWAGFIEGGKLKIRLQFEPNHFVKTYKLLEKRNNDGKWENYESYNKDFADSESPDYSYIALCLDVYLVPTVDNGRLSYTLPSAKWSWYEDKGFWWPKDALVSNPFAPPYGHPTEKAMLEKYKNDIMNTLQQMITIAFAGYEIKNLLTNALNDKVKSGEHSNQRIGSTSISEDGTTIIIQFLR